MATIVTRAGKGSPLTNTEVDSNFTNLNSDKLERNGSNLATKIAFDTTAALTPTTGQLVWDADTGTVDIGLNGATAPVMSVGEDQFYRVINQTGSTITKGTLVMAFGTVGASGLIKVKAWDATQPSKTIMGLVLADIPTENSPTESGFGYVLAFGKIKGIQTNGGNYGQSWADGDIIYAGASSGLTKTLPAAPSTKTTIAIVINSHATNGTLFVRPSYGSSLGEDELVQLSGLANADVLSYDSTDGRFENKTLAAAGIYATSNPAGYTTNTGTVTSVGGTGTVNGITLTGTVTSSGNLTLGGTLSGVNLTSQVTGTLPVANGGTGITSFGSGVATWLGTPSSANLAAAVTDETGTGALVFANSPTLVTPALGTPASGVVTNLTGTASININGTVGATTPAAGAFTTLNTSGAVVFNEAGANVDFRVEGDTEPNLLFVDASADNVGIGTSAPATLLHVFGTNNLSSIETRIEQNGTSNVGLRIKRNGSDIAYFGNGAFSISGGSSTDASLTAVNNLLFGAGGSTERARIDSSGNLLVGTTSVGTFSGNNVVRIGSAGAIITQSDTLDDSGTDFTDINLETTGGGYQGFMLVSNTATGGANVRTQTTFSVFGRGTDASIQQIATDDGTSGACVFTVTVPSNGVIRVTNTSIFNTSVHIQFFGGTSF